jgi:hypothetical protein
LISFIYRLPKTNVTVYTSSRGKSSPLHSYPLTTFHLHLRSWKKNQQMRRHKKLCSIEDTWMTSTVWTVPTWSVFNQSIRTNNDVEGWHHKLNRKAHKGNLVLSSHYSWCTLKQKDCRHRWRWSPRGNSKDTDTKGAVPSRASCFKCGRSTTATKSARIISWSVVQSTVPGARLWTCILYILMWNT